MKLLKKLEITHDKLFKQPAFILWLALASLTLSIMLLLLLINYMLPMGDFYSYLAEWRIFGVLLFAAFTFMLSILNSEHRTVQTKYQINATESKNRTDLFLSHYKFNIELLEKMKITRSEEGFTEVLSLNIVSPSVTYRMFYPRNNIRDGVIDLMPVNIKDSTLQVIESIYERHKTISDENKGEVKNKPQVNFEELISRGRLIELIYNNSYFTLESLLTSHGMKIESHTTNGEASTVKRNVFASVAPWDTHVLETMLIFWIEVNTWLGSDIDEKTVKNIKSQFGEFTENMFNDCY